MCGLVQELSRYSNNVNQHSSCSIRYLNGQVIEQKERGVPIDCNWQIGEKQTYYVYSKQLNGAVGTANNVEVQRKLHIVNGVSRNVDKIVQLMWIQLMEL